MKRPLVLVASLVLTLPQSNSIAEEAIKLGPLATEIEGPYEATLGGVPLLGYVVQRMTAGNVKFMLCNNKFVDLEEKLLARSQANCPTPGKGERNNPGVNPWVVLHGALVPADVLASSTDQQAVVKKFGVGIDSLPENIRSDLIKRPAGELSAFTFRGIDGKRVLGVIRTPRLRF